MPILSGCLMCVMCYVVEAEAQQPFVSLQKRIGFLL